MALYRTSGANPTGDAVETNVLSGKTFSNASGTDKVGTMPNNGAVSPSALSPNGSYTIPEGYHNGNGVVTASPNTGTYSPTTRNAALDMGISNLNRYVNTNGVPNSNSGTYTFASGDTGGTKDLGVTNTYRYVNATNVYNKGKEDGSGSLYQYAISVGLNPDFIRCYNLKTGVTSYATNINNGMDIDNGKHIYYYGGTTYFGAAVDVYKMNVSGQTPTSTNITSIAGGGAWLVKYR